MSDSKEKTPTKFKLEFVEITKSFLSGKIIANNKITLQIANNEVHSIVGENGSGKSTLMSILFGLYKQDSGQIKIDNKIVDMYNAGATRKFKIGMVHQHFHLVEDFTVLQNIILGQEKLPITNSESKYIDNKIAELNDQIAKYLNENPKLKEINKKYLLLKDERKILQKNLDFIRDNKKYRSLKKTILQLEYDINKLNINQEKNEKKIKKYQLNLEEKQSELHLLREEKDYFNIKEREQLIHNKIKQLRNNKLKNLIKIENEKYILERDLLTRNAANFFGLIDFKKNLRRFYALSNYYKIRLDPYIKVKQLSIGDRQKVEIFKVLWQEKDILVFDEPTATLSVLEIKDLLELIKKLKENNKTVIFISHKLSEVKQISDKISVLNRGKLIKTFVNNKRVTINQISQLMIGKTIDLKFEKTKPNNKVVLDVKNLSYVTKKGFKAVDNVNFQIYENEIFGLAGIEGNGQEEIFNIISGLKKPVVNSEVIYFDENNDAIDLLKTNIKKRLEFVSHVPINRFKHGIVSQDSLLFNSFITSFRDNQFYKFKLKKINRNFLINTKQISEITDEIINTLNVEGANEKQTPIKDLSGGNQQKFMFGRELLRNHRLFLAGHPTRGLDINAIKNIYELLIDNNNHKATLLYSLELSELIAVCNRIAILYKGKIVNIINPNEYSLGVISNMLVGRTD